MIRSARARVLQLGLACAVVATFVVVDWIRAGVQTTESKISMGGWAGFVVLFCWWLWEDCGIVAGFRRVGRQLVLTVIAFGVLYLYYRRSRLVDAGVEIDAIYTFIGLGWFTEGVTPITFAGQTVSFPQMPMQLFVHLPGRAIGFDRLGPFAVHLGIMLQTAFLLALLVDTVVDARLAARAGAVALAAGVFSNRLTVLLCNLTGYAIPSVSIGIMFLGLAVGGPTFERAAPWIGGLLMLAIMHHYPGFFFVLPLVALWVVAGPAPRARIATFARANLPLWVVLAMAVACFTLQPRLLLTRVRDVSVPTTSLADFHTRLALNWDNLIRFFPAQFVTTFFRRSEGSWHLLDVAPLGGPIGPIVVANWVMTAVALGPRARRFARGLAALAACLVGLTALQHLATNFENYRDMTLLLPLVTIGVGFVLALPERGAMLRALLVAYGVAVAAVQYVDVATLAGRHYAVEEYAPGDQAIMETLRRDWRRDDGRLRGAELHVVIGGDLFPLGRLYQPAAARHEIVLEFTTSKEFCGDPRAAVEKAARAGCGRIAFAMRSDLCRRERHRLGWPPSHGAGVALYLLDGSCDPSLPVDWSSPDLVELPSSDG